MPFKRYFEGMKYLMALCILSMALQPLPLQACSMDDDHGAQHASMQGGETHDCCPSETEEAAPSCADSDNCGSCTMGVTLIASAIVTTVASWSSQYAIIGEDQYTGPPNHALFRPPIS